MHISRCVLFMQYAVVRPHARNITVEWYCVQCGLTGPALQHTPAQGEAYSKPS